MKALVVDDSRAMRMVLRRIVSEIGFEVVEAADGQQALDKLDEGVPDVALVDWNMPVMDGLSFVTAARSRSDARRMTIMMVTTESEHGQIVRALAAGAHEYLIKPFTADALVDKLRFLGLVPNEEAVAW
ncbi:MAG: response regulator [Jatrophihabitans sp.]|uniref:response regulator n=1 Tax=Jatrophihabitans sp. TaxID=1932789 RepID=UPI003F80C471